ncbi:hypothetical protein AB0O75_39240 [Streptomyces sp. NPDC088921]|uniref:hypothetical protein n=1 Tax=unclassified Streptomyces TaxID=2593676 RepID=UPI003438108E
MTTLGMAAGAVSLLPTQSQGAPEPTVDEVRKQVEKRGSTGEEAGHAEDGHYH